MLKNKIMSYILSIIGTVLVIGGLYILISYLSFLGKGAIDFVSTNNVDTISRCGIVVPDMFIQLRDQFATVVVPVLYLGIPVAMILVSIIWFFSGYYFGRYSVEEDLAMEVRKKQEIKQEVEERIRQEKFRSLKRKKRSLKKRKKKRNTRKKRQRKRKDDFYFFYFFIPRMCNCMLCCSLKHPGLFHILLLDSLQ